MQQTLTKYLLAKYPLVLTPSEQARLFIAVSQKTHIANDCPRIFARAFD